MIRNLFRAVALMAALLCVPAQPAHAQVAVYDAANYVKNTLTELHTLQIVMSTGPAMTIDAVQVHSM